MVLSHPVHLTASLASRSQAPHSHDPPNASRLCQNPQKGKTSSFRRRTATCNARVPSCASKMLQSLCNRLPWLAGPARYSTYFTPKGRSPFPFRNCPVNLFFAPPFFVPVAAHAACRRSQVRDRTRITAVTTLDPLIPRPPGNSHAFLLSSINKI